jgi:hypothetical protein
LLSQGSGFVLGVAGLQSRLLRQVQCFNCGRRPAVIILELDRQLTAPRFDVGTAGRPTLVQAGVDTDDLPDRPLRRIGVGSLGEPHPQRFAEMLLQGGVVVFRRGDIGLEEDPAVDGQPPSVEGLHFVRHGNVGVQVWIPGPAVPVGERGADQTSYVDLPDPLRPDPGEQGMLLEERQSVLHSGLMGPFNDGRHRRFGDRP